MGVAIVDSSSGMTLANPDHASERRRCKMI